MTLADEINKMIEAQLKGAIIISPRFTDYRVADVLVQETPDLEQLLKSENDKTDFTESLNLELTRKGKTPVKQTPTKEEVQDMLSKVGIDPSNLANLLSMTSGKGGLGLMGRIGGIAGLGAPIGVGLMLPTVVQAVIKELQRPGGLLDKRVKIDARNETLAELSRQTRQNTRIGDRQVIIQQFQGFRNYDGYASTNTRDLIRDNADRVLNIGLLDKAQGVQ